jgi:hypothetical protein
MVEKSNVHGCSGAAEETPQWLLHTWIVSIAYLSFVEPASYGDDDLSSVCLKFNRQTFRNDDLEYVRRRRGSIVACTELPRLSQFGYKNT